MIPDGLEPSLPGCGPGVFASGPRDHRSDQGESRTPMPVKARRSERRVSANSTTWPISSTGGNRTHRHSPRFELGRFAGLRTVPVPGAGVEPASAASETDVLPVRRPRNKRKERELNPQGLSLGRFRDGCHRQLACPSVQAAAAGIEPAIVSLTGSRLTIGPHRKKSIGTRGTRTLTTLVKSQVCCR
jgi:hypothetical protein